MPTVYISHPYLDFNGAIIILLNLRHEWVIISNSFMRMHLHIHALYFMLVSLIALFNGGPGDTPLYKVKARPCNFNKVYVSEK